MSTLLLIAIGSGALAFVALFVLAICRAAANTPVVPSSQEECQGAHWSSAAHPLSDAERVQELYEALVDAAGYLRLAYTWTADTDRHEKIRAAYQRALAALTSESFEGVGALRNSEGECSSCGYMEPGDPPACANCGAKADDCSPRGGSQ
jgi:hypothetical protein